MDGHVHWSNRVKLSECLRRSEFSHAVFFSSFKMLIETGTLRFIDFSILDRFNSMYVMAVLCTFCSLKMIPSLFMTVIIVIRNHIFNQCMPHIG